MCGIAGIYQTRPGPPLEESRVLAMCEALRHRGPDDQGTLMDGPLALGMRRLSIVDIAGGHQPIFNEDGRLAIVFNGEVYNFRELRARCEARGHRFTTQTDTEAVLHLYEEEGPACVERLNGMFAFAIWDRSRREIFLARDRFGIKPLYYYQGEGELRFASELKGLLAAGPMPRHLDLAALDQYLTFLWVPEPATILEGVKKLPAGCWMRVGSEGVTVQRYWDLQFEVEPSMSEAEAAPRLRSVLQEAVVRQTVADVPVDAFLSGGLDSSTVVALLALADKRPNRVHAVGFARRDQAYEGFPDDLPYARLVARHFGLEYRETVLEPRVMELLPRLVWHLDEPLADPAIVPAYLICQASQEAGSKVLLSGMGGDEIFGGYRRHLAEGMVARYLRLPSFLRRNVVEALVERLPSAGRWPLAPTVRRAKRALRAAALPPEERLIDYAAWTTPAERAGLYVGAARAALDGSDARGLHRQALEQVRGQDTLNRMLYLDARLYLPSHNLNYTDKMSMAASVEVRVPFLDNAVVDFATRLPPSLKVRGMTGKYLLRRAMEGVLPRPILRRGKAGFGAPIRAWLARDLRPLVEDLLSEERIARRGLFEPAAVGRLVQANAQGREDYSYPLWALLTLELWMDAYKVEAPQ